MQDRTRCNCGCNKKLSRKNLLRHARGEGLLHIKDQYTQQRDPIRPAQPNPRTRSPGDADGPPRKRQRVSDAQSLREICGTSGAANIAGPSTSTGVADQMMDTTTDFDDVDMPTEPVEDSDPESGDSGFNDWPKSQYMDDDLSALGDNKEEEANRPMINFNTGRTSRGGTVLNINRDYIAHIHFNLLPEQWVPPKAMNQIFQHAHAASGTPSRSVVQVPRPSEPPSAQIAKTCVAVHPFSNHAKHSIDEVCVMISMVQTMMANPMLCSSKDLPETLVSLKRLLMLMELAFRAYRHTDLARSLSRAISIGVKECRRLLDDLITNLTNLRHHLSNTVLYFVRKYMWAKIGWQSSAITALDSKLRKSHSSFAACLLALGRAAWPELKREQGQETLDELAKFYVQLEQESTSLRHIKVDAAIVQDYLGRNLHVPTIFCTTSQDFHVVMTGFCRGLPGDDLIRRGSYRILDSEDDQVINPEEFAIVLQPGIAVGMSIVLRELAEKRQGSEGYSCPRCQHVNSRCTGWVTCGKCNGSFKISPEEECMVSPAIEQHLGTDSIPNEIHLFRKIWIFQVAARITHRSSLFGGGFLLSPSPIALRESMAGHSFNPQGFGGSHTFWGGDLHGPGLICARSAPGAGRSIPGIGVEPPTDPHVLEMQWNEGSFQDGKPFMQGYPFASAPKEIPRFDIQSHMSSESGFFNPFGLPNQYADFHDDASDHDRDNHISPSNELFDLDEYLNLNALPDVPLMSPQWRTSQDDFISWPDPSSPVPLSPFTHQSASYGSPYSMNNMSLQGQRSPTHDEASSPNSGLAFDGREITLPPHPSQRSAVHRSSLSGDGLLLLPSPTALRRSHSHGSISSRGHRYTSSDAESMAGHYFNPTLVSPTGSYHSSQGSGGSDRFLGADLHGPGLIRARSAPRPGSQRIQRRAGTPYERPKTYSNVLGAVPLDIPAYNTAGVSTTSNCTEGSSPSSPNERGVATLDMMAAAEKRRKIPATYQCPQCLALFITEMSRKRHIASHHIQTRFSCTKPGCGYTFTNDIDRKRHEMKSKKHATMHESTFPRPGIEPLLRRGLSSDGTSENLTSPHLITLGSFEVSIYIV